MLYVATYNELEQLHMQIILNCHLAAILELAVATEPVPVP